MAKVILTIFKARRLPAPPRVGGEEEEMAYASEDLRNEHEGILHGLGILESMAGRLEAGREVPRSDLLGMVEFFRLFADTCHHGKEEGLLFPALEGQGIAREGGPIGQMLLEHLEGRGYVAGMAQALGEGGSPAAFAESARAYLALLRAHIAKENEVLFPLADRILPPALQAELGEAYERHEEEVMGAGTHERLHGLLRDLEARYGA